MIKKLRWKLTFFNSIVLLSILIFIAIFVYVTVNINVLNNTDNDLIEAAYQVKRFLPMLEQYNPSEELTDLNEEYSVFNEKMTVDQIAYGLWDEHNDLISFNGNFQISTEALSEIRQSIFTVDPKSVRLIEQSDGDYYIHIYNYENIHIRVCTTVTSDQAGNLRYVQTITNMNEKDTMADRLLRTLIFAGLLGVSLSLISGYFIAGRSIVPIEESVMRQKEFVADASHELRTPITIVRTNLDALKSFEDETVASQMNWIDHAYEETERMEKLINDLLFLAKADLNETFMDHHPIELHTLLTDMIEKFQPVASKKNINFRYLAEVDSLTILGDREKIQQLFANVIMNAIQYSTDDGTITIQLNKKKQTAEVLIQDEGIGIEQTELENIFKRFYRADKARSRRAGGTGLGLSIAKWIVEAHKGVIYAESELLHGTTFIIHLPLKEGE